MNAIAERDEIGDIVASATATCDEALRACQLGHRMLPCERGQEAWPMTIAEKIDPALAKQYPLIDLDSVMAHLHPKKYKDCPAPRFAMYKAFGKGKCKLTIVRENGDATAPAHWPAAALTKLTEAVKNSPPPKKVTPQPEVTAAMSPWELAMRGMWGGEGMVRTTLTLRARFIGHIPSEVRKKIHDAKPQCDEVYLIQEVHEWSAEQTVERIDPLVVGLKNGVAYLIDRFDTTTFEEYVAKEFTS